MNQVMKFRPLIQSAQKIDASGMVFTLAINERPLPRTFDMANIIISQIQRVEKQKKNDWPFFVQNKSHSLINTVKTEVELTEMQFINLIVNKTNSWISLDLVNILENAEREKRGAYDWIDMIDLVKVGMIRLKKMDSHLGYGANEKLWDLYSYVVQKICPFVVVVDEDDIKTSLRAEKIANSFLPNFSSRKKIKFLKLVKG